MRIGLDFDNTIVSYDALFYKVACEKKLISPDHFLNKLLLRDYLRKTGRELQWTEMQGEVYGIRMNEAQAFPGVIDFIVKSKEVGHTLTIISHKTRYPFIGPKYDLQAAANEWIHQNLTLKNNPLFEPNQIFFEATKEMKINRIEELDCNIFIDDLPEILLAENFYKNAKRILFDPEKNHNNITCQFKSFSSWEDISEHLSIK